jgi:hypothetical protein
MAIKWSKNRLIREILIVLKIFSRKNFEKKGMSGDFKGFLGIKLSIKWSKNGNKMVKKWSKNGNKIGQ